MTEGFLDFITVITPILVAFIGYLSVRSEKNAKKMLESQQLLEKAKAEIDEKNAKEIKEKISRMENSIVDMSNKMGNMESRLQKIDEMNNRIDSVIELSTINYEFTLSLSNVVESIGLALDATDSIKTDNLKQEIQEHKKKDLECRNRIMKIMY